MRPHSHLMKTVSLLIAIVAGIGTVYTIPDYSQPPAHDSYPRESQAPWPVDKVDDIIPADAPRTAVASAIDITVHDEGGSPICDAELISFDSKALDPTRKIRRIATSDSEGRLRSNEARIPGELLIKHPHYQSLRLGDYSIACENRKVTLVAGATVEIEAIDEQGGAVPSVTIKLIQNRSSDGTGSYSDTRQTGGDGKVVFAGLDHGPFAFTADSDTHIVTHIALGDSAPTSGTIRLCSPLVAFGKSRWPLDSFEGCLSTSLLNKDATPQGPAQVSVTRFIEQLRGGSPDKVAFAIRPPLASLTEADCFEVSYLAGGEWGFARLPFRRMAEPLEPTLFGDSVATPRGELVQLVVRARTGQDLDCSNMRLRIVPQDGPATAHAIRIYRANQVLRLPKGKYILESKSFAVDGSIGDKSIVIAEDNPSNDIRLIEVVLSRHLFAATPQLRAVGGTSAGNFIDSGTVFVKSESGHADVYYSTEGNLPSEIVFLAEGSNTVRVTGLQGQVREVYIQVSASGTGVLTDDGKLVEGAR